MIIKAIIFDFGEVLNAPVDPELTARRFERLARRLDLQADELWPYLFESEASRLWMTGKLDGDGFWTAVLEPRGIKDPDETRAFAQEVFADHKVLHPEMVELVKELKGRYKLAVLSNASRTEEEMEEMFQHDFGLPGDLFDTIVTSTSVGATKPDPTIFIEVIRRLDVRPEEAIFTDDMASFTAAAFELGIRSHTFTTPSAFLVYLREEGVLH
ncbi:MAG: HAD family phosphatase [Candidatus Promineifilaceae bacterium]